MYSKRVWDGFLKLDILSEENIEELEKKLEEVEEKKQKVIFNEESSLMKPLKNATVFLKDKISKAKKYEVITKRGAIAALVYVKDTDNIVLVEQWRPSTQEKYLEVPAGTIDEDNPLETLKRELMEEIGLEVYDENITLVVEGVQPSPGWLNEAVNLYFVEVEEKQFTGEGGGLEEESEDIEIVKMSSEEFLEYNFKDMKTILLQLFFRT